jgi:hypothetical protein
LQLTVNISEAADASETLLTTHQTTSCHEPETIIKVVHNFFKEDRMGEACITRVIEIINACTFVGKFKGICHLGDLFTIWRTGFRWVGSMTEN